MATNNYVLKRKENYSGPAKTQPYHSSTESITHLVYLHGHCLHVFLFFHFLPGNCRLIPRYLNFSGLFVSLFEFLLLCSMSWTIIMTLGNKITQINPRFI